jgi:hypothetical protein
MTIACLGWGSLIWNPGELPIDGTWHKDGPWLPVEFARHSEGKDPRTGARTGRDRMTLVLVSGRKPVETLWAKFKQGTTLSCAQLELAKREGIEAKNIPRDIGTWEGKPRQDDEFLTAVHEWAVGQRNLDAVVWTALPPKFNNQRGLVPTEKEVLSFLRGLINNNLHDRAEAYVRCAPSQVKTAYRESIEIDLKWTSRTTCGPGGQA